MALKFRYRTKEEVPAEQSSLYFERDGAWVLDAEGAVEKSKLDEFRTNNVALQKQLTELQRQFEGVDPGKVTELLEAQRKLQEGELLKKGDVDAVVTNRIKAAVAPLE